MPITDQPLPPFVANNIAALERALGVIDGLPERVFADHFTDQSGAAFSASVGEHFRHVIEHYRLFLDGWPGGSVDYDARPRNAQLETDPARARAAIDDLCQRLRALPAGLDPGLPVAVRCRTGSETGSETGSAGEQPVPSCVGRELVFLHGHSVHHFALIVLILKHRGITVAQDFGIAPSTSAAVAAGVKGAGG